MCESLCLLMCLLANSTEVCSCIFGGFFHHLFSMLFFRFYRCHSTPRPTHCTGFEICSQRYRQIDVPLPVCSTSHDTNVTTQRAFGCLSTTEKSHWHGWIDLIQSSQASAIRAFAVPDFIKAPLQSLVTRRNVRGWVWHENERYGELMHFIHNLTFSYENLPFGSCKLDFWYP